MKRVEPVPFASFLYAAAAGQLVFAVPAIVGGLLFDLLEGTAALIILVALALISIPIGAAFAWLIAKGSNWVNTPVAMTAVCSLPGRIYGPLFGGLLGFRLFSATGGVVLAVLFYLVARVATVPVSRFIMNRIIPHASQEEA